MCHRFFLLYKIGQEREKIHEFFGGLCEMPVGVDLFGLERRAAYFTY